MTPFKLKILTPDGIHFEGEATSVTATTEGGDVQILARHADYLAPLGTGTAKVAFPDGSERTAACSGGFISVISGSVNLCATTFEFKEDIDLERAISAEKRARAELASSSDERLERIARAKINRAMSRIRVAKSK